jgi:hypothetical protein
MLNFHLARHEQHQQLQEHRRLLLHHLVDRGSTATLKSEVHLADGVGVQHMTRTMDVAATVRWTYRCEECRAVVGNTVCPASTARAKRLIHSLLRQKL